MRGILGPHSAVALAVALFLVLGLGAAAQAAQAEGGLDPADPMVRVTAGKLNINPNSVLEGVAQDVKAATGLGPELVTYYWQTFDAIVLAGKPVADKPLFVDLYVPCFLTQKQVAGMLNALADSLAKRTGMDKKWVFIHTHFPREGHVYIDGKIMSGCTPPAGASK